MRSRTLSNVSCMSSSTFWSAASVHTPTDEKPSTLLHPTSAVRKIDSGVSLESRERGHSFNSRKKPTASRSRQSSFSNIIKSGRKRSMSGDTTQTTHTVAWDSAEAITEARRQKRIEIEQSLEMKYPNDRVHGEFLPFNTDFSHSSDSLSPVHFECDNLPESEREKTPLEPTTIAWKNMDALREEYEKADKKKGSIWGRIRRRILGSCGGKEWWEDGDDDKGSVRRYRLELPTRDALAQAATEGSKPLPQRVRSVGPTAKQAIHTPPLVVPDVVVGDVETGSVIDKWSVMGVMDGRRVLDGRGPEAQSYLQRGVVYS
ncbi:Protein of unknown function [Pyronema omphalodes CBS 100304]|uniref:Uncharacterized protein n=1 Tax=Pyronema omphalodes (strain CBS 100304) TaxID=1076935 RepID=U4L723_PYROM|nr:Protein of unknown function [Pyronema omphalodes CBS 100304]